MLPAIQTAPFSTNTCGILYRAVCLPQTILQFLIDDQACALTILHMQQLRLQCALYDIARQSAKLYNT